MQFTGRGAVAIRFNKTWDAEIAEVTTSAEYQNCKVKVIDPKAVRYPGPNYDNDPSDVTEDGYDPFTNKYLDPVIDGVLYQGQARFIPVRAGIFHGGEAQLNANIDRAMRLQFPHDAAPFHVKKGCTVKILEAPRNLSLVGAWGSVSDDFQGAASASRTITVFMDSDAARS